MSADCYLLTGGTGVVGSAFAELVLRDTDAQLWLLIRPSSSLTPAQRLDALFRFWRLGDAEADARGRVRVLEGDTEAPRLGLSPEDWQSAVTHTTHLVHSAASVKMTRPWPDARRAAVTSLESVLDLAGEARAHHLRKVELVSTVGVSGVSSAPLAEDWLETPRRFHNTYEAAKAEAEQVARAAARAGLPLTVHRPSMVVGQSRTGRILQQQIFYRVCDFLSGQRLGGVFPPLDRARLDVVPVDWVARLLLTSSRTPAWAGRVLHACSADDAVPLPALRTRVHQALRARGRPVQFRATLPLGAFQLAAWLGRRVGGPRTRTASRLLDVLLAYLQDEQHFENHATRALAASAGLTFPRPDEYLDTVLAAWLSPEPT